MTGFAVIPTRTERATLWPLLEVLVDAEVQPVIVRTKPDAEILPDAVNLDGHDRMSISYWWNVGLDHVAATAPAAPTLVLNDDLAMTVDMVTALIDALGTHDLVWSKNTSPQMHTPFSGACFGLPAGAIRVDEAFTWWHADDDLYRRARAAGMSCAAVDVQPVHVRAADYERWDETMFADVIPTDQALYFTRWDGVPYA
jgi:hypothetical protein